MSHEFSNDSSKYFKRVVRLMARAFYDEAPALEKKLKPGQSDNKGLGVLILDRLTNVHWVKEEDLVNMLNVHRKQVTSLLHLFHREKLINMEYRKEVYDVLRYRLHHINKKLSFNHGSKRDIQESYVCSKCEGRFDVFTAMDNNFCCTRCNDLLECANASEILDERDETKIQLRQKVEADVGISDVKEEKLKEKPKAIPPWMKREGMNLTQEQSEEIKASNDSSPPKSAEDFKPTNNANTVDEDYVQSYYAQFTRTNCTEDNAKRIVGEKSKREESDEEDSECDDPFETGNFASQRKGDSEQKENDFVKEEETKGVEEEDGDDDDIEWES